MSWEAPLASIVAVVGGVIAYAVQKHFDRREQVRARHYAAYVEMVQAICALGNATNRGGVGKEDALSDYATAKMKFAIVASENAMKKFVTFDRLITSGNKVPHNEFDRSLAEFMREVRMENLGSTHLSNEELIVVTPFGRSLDRREQ